MYADVSGARIWYEDTQGDGPAVVLLHAGTGSAPMWRLQTPVFAQAGLRVIAYDRRGYGKSEGAPEGIASDDLRGLLDQLKIERAHLVGTAAGAIVAIDFALSYPQRVRGLVVASSHVGVQDEEYARMQRRLRPSPQFEQLPAEIRELGPSYRAANAAGVQEWIALERASRASGTPTMPKTRNRMTFAALESLAVPTLLLCGDADLYVPPSVLRMFEKRIRGARAVVLPECGHSAYWEQPALFNKTVLDFIKQY